MTKLIEPPKAVIAVNEFVFFLVESTKLLSLILSDEENILFAVGSDFEKYFTTNQGIYRAYKKSHFFAFDGLLKVEHDEYGLEFIVSPSFYTEEETEKIYGTMSRRQEGEFNSSLYLLLNNEYVMARLYDSAITEVGQVADASIVRHKIEGLGLTLDLIKERLIQYTPNEEYAKWYKVLRKYYDTVVEELKGKVPTTMTGIDATFFIFLLMKVAKLECKPGIRQKLIADLIGTSEGTIKGSFHTFKEKEDADGWRERLLRISSTLGDEAVKTQLIAMFDEQKDTLFKD